MREVGGHLAIPAPGSAIAFLVSHPGPLPPILVTRSWAVRCSRCLLACTGLVGLRVAGPRPWRFLRWGVRVGYRVLLNARRKGRLAAVSPSPSRTVVGLPRQRRGTLYDAETKRWARGVLQHGQFVPPFPRDDPEAAHDAQRLRGVLPLLAELAHDPDGTGVGERMEQLLRHTAREAERRPQIGWDTTTAALRLLTLMDAAEILRREGSTLPGMDGWLRGFTLAHEPVLRLGAAVEPEGNHRAINAAGRAALHLLLRDQPLQGPAVAELAAVFASQFLADGGHVERSPHYHLQTVALLDRIAGADAARGGCLRDRTRSSSALPRAALAALLGPGGAPLRWGDVGRTFSGRRAAAEAREAVDRTVSRDDDTILPDFGFASWRWGAGAAELRLDVDFGALGMDGNTGHGHADALAFSFHVDGHEVVADPASYLYSNAPDAIWFKLAGAHSTVRWPGRPSHVLSRFFRWRRAPRPPVRIARPDDASYAFAALHEWRSGLGVYRHLRRWALLPDGLAVFDTVSSTSRESAVARLAMSPDSVLQLHGPARATVAWSGGGVEIDIHGDVGGALQPRPGWYAPCYGVRRAASALEVPLPARRIATLCTRFRVLR